jgi:hypothetical protein
MVFLQGIAWVLIVAAFLVLGDEIYVWIATGTYHVHALGELWYSLAPSSLNMLQAGVQRDIAPWLWDSVIQPILLLPAWMVFGVPGLSLRMLVFIRPKVVESPPRKLR